MAITQSERTEFVGAHITPAAKETLSQMVLRGQIRTRSEFIAQAIQEKIDRTPFFDDRQPCTCPGRKDGKHTPGCAKRTPKRY